MPSSFSQNLGIELPADGELDGLWGDVVNENMNILDRAINGTVTLTLTGTASTLTTSDGVLSDGQYKLLVLSGTPSGTHTITIAPNDAQKIYFVSNISGQSVVFTQGSGSTVTVANGDTAIIYMNGAGVTAGVFNLTDHFAMNSVKITGGAITGATINNAVIGGTTPVAGTFTTLSGTTSLTSPLLSAGLGTVSAPSVTFTGDTNTGIWSPGADILAMSTGGVERMRLSINSLVLPALTTETRQIEVGSGRTGDGSSFVDLVGDATYTDYGARFIRLGGANGNTQLLHRGTGGLQLTALDAGVVQVLTNGLERMRAHASGGVSIGNITDPGATNLSVTGVVSNSLGAAATPSITFTGDLNTGVWSPAADTFAISTGGVERLRIDSAGEVGIGTNNPLRPLHIVTSGATNAAAYLQNDTGDATIFLRSQDTGAVSIQFGDTTAFNSGLIQYSNSTDSFMSRSAGAMTFQTGGATERARIHASGGVSIGNATDPGATNLSVAGAISTGDAATTRTNLGLTIGTNVQAYDAGLQSISGLTTAANQMIYTTAADTYATTALTAAGRALLDDTNAAAQRTTLGLGTLATQSGTFSGTSSGTNTGDQNIFQNIAVAGQTTVVADSTADTLTLAAGSGVTITTNATTDTITIAATGSGGTVTSVGVSGGTTGLTTSGGPITGSGTITLAGTLALANGGTGATTAANARTNLGLGTAATLNVGTGANNIVQLDGSARLPAVDGSQLTGLVSFPAGGIILWSGSVASIPSGWALCDGFNGTPNLRDRFVVGAGSTYAVAATGGQNTITSVPAHTHGVGNLANASDGAHTHNGSTSTAADHTHSHGDGSVNRNATSNNNTYTASHTSAGGVPGTTRFTDPGGAHSHNLSIVSAGAHTHAISGNTASTGNASVDVRPLYYALAYIMKL